MAARRVTFDQVLLATLLLCVALVIGSTLFDWFGFKTESWIIAGGIAALWWLVLRSLMRPSIATPKPNDAATYPLNGDTLRVPCGSIWIAAQGGERVVAYGLVTTPDGEYVMYENAQGRLGGQRASVWLHYFNRELP
jgi:hypothetical protein